MTHLDFSSHLKALGLRQKRFAELTGYHPTTVSKWANDVDPVPPVVELLLRLSMVSGFKLEDVRRL